MNAPAAPVRTDWTREELIAICQRAVVPVKDWRHLQAAEVHEKHGLCWVLLTAGCEFTVQPAAPEGTRRSCATDAQYIWVFIAWPDVSDLRLGTRPKAPAGSNCAAFRLPTPARLDEAAGKDWY